MEEYDLNPAMEIDFPAIRELIHSVQINPTGLDWRRFWVARTKNGSIIGCGQVKPHGDEILELASIAVVPAWRQRGVASAIIWQLLAIYPGTLYLTCRSSLGKFYRRFGFEVVTTAEMPPYFRRISRLMNVVMKVGLAGESLLVMKRN